jgi:hypothetical protein
MLYEPEMIILVVVQHFADLFLDQLQAAVNRQDFAIRW